jgi:hypothetical protein
MKRTNKLILEFSEFNAQRLNPDSAQMAIHVDNPQLSVNAFDKHEDAIRSGVSRINNILHALSNTGSFRALKSKLALEDQKITNLKVLRIVNRDFVNWDFYVSFVISEEEYYGVIKNMTSKNPEFTSEVFKDFDLIQTPEWMIRIRGLIIKTLKNWLRPELGNYKLLNDEVICYSQDLGKMIKLKKGTQVEVTNTFENKIIIKYDSDYCILQNQNFIYFNYWFENLDQVGTEFKESTK